MQRDSVIRRLVLPATRLHVPFVSAWLATEVERRLGDREVECRVRDLRWRLDLNELIDHHVYYLGTHERFTTRRVLDAMPPNGVFMDVGANFGYFTLLVAHQLRGKGSVYAFEPMGRAMNKLREHLALNNLTNVVTEKVVLTDRPVGPIDVAFQNSWRLYDTDERGRHVERISTTTLDAYVEEHQISRVDVMKVDVDGHELKVLTGAADMLRKLRPTIMIELGIETLRSAGDSIHDLVELLSTAGYRFYSERTMRRFPSNEALLSALPRKATLNVVCRPA